MPKIALPLFDKIDRSQPWYSLVFTAVVGAVALIWALSSDWQSTAGRWPDVLLFAALAAMAEYHYVGLPMGKGRISIGFAINFGAILLFQPHEAAFIALCGMLIPNLIQRLAPDVILFNISQIWITAGTTAVVWQKVKWAEGLSPQLPIDLPGALLCMLVYFLLNAALFSIGLTLAYRASIREIVNKNILWVFPNHMALGSLGFLAATLYLSAGFYGVVLLAIPLALARYSYQQYIGIRQAHLETIQALASALDAKDPHTRGHSDRVSQYAVEIGRALKLPESENEKLLYAGILHDIGKIGISDTVLNKVGRLTDEEFDIIKSHAVIGAQMVRPVGFLRGVSDFIRHHHERYDGKGYPDGLAGEDIPLGARILGVADAFDAMTNDRVYRARLGVERAVSQLMQGRGTQFDPEIVEVFINEVLPKYAELWEEDGTGPLSDDEVKQADGNQPQGDQVWRGNVGTPSSDWSMGGDTGVGGLSAVGE